MLTIKKLWNILNHAGKPWQISLAVSLAFIAGLTPILSLHNILILLLVLVLNVHLGMFLLATAFFGGIAYAVDPISHALGLMLLTNGSLEGLWISLYNSAFFKLSNFNNAIVLGSLVISVVLFYPLYKIVNGILIKYRETIAVKIANIPLLNKLQYFHNEEENVNCFRFAGVAVFIIIAGLIGAVNIIFLDDAIKSNLEKTVNAKSGKVLNIGNLKLSLFDSKLQLSDIKVQDKNDPASNINIKNITVDIDIAQFILKKAVIENIVIEQASFPNQMALKEVKDPPKQEEKSVKEVIDDKFSLPDLSNIDLSNIKNILNSNASGKFEEYKKYYEKIKPVFNSQSTSKEKIVHIRGEGSWVKFDDNSNIPQLLIKNGAFGVTFQEQMLKGDFKDFTTDQMLYKRPFHLTVTLNNEKVKNLSLIATMLNTEETDIDSFNISADTVDLPDHISDKFTLKNSKVKISGALKISDASNLTGSAKVDVITTDIALKESNKYIKMLNDSLIGVKNIKGDVKVSGTLANSKIDVDSNIQDVIKQKTKDIIKDQKKVIKKEIKKKVETKIQEKLGEKLKGEKGNMLKGLLGF